MDGTIVERDIGRGRRITDEMIPVHAIHSITAWQGDREVGRTFVILPQDRDDAVILDVIVYWPEDRRRGYASDMLQYATRAWNKLITGYRSKAGLHLCLKNGFQLTRPLFKSGKSLLTFNSCKGGSNG